MIGKRNQQMETMKLKNLTQKCFTFFIFQAVKWAWISLIHCLFNIASLENSWIYPCACLASSWPWIAFFSFSWFPIWIDLIAYWSVESFPLNWFFKGKREKKVPCTLFLTVYIDLFAKRKCIWITFKVSCIISEVPTLYLLKQNL